MRPILTKVLKLIKNGALGVSLYKAKKEEKDLYDDYIRGEGIEIGALHSPYPVDDEKVKKIMYVDRLPIHVLR